MEQRAGGGDWILGLFSKMGTVLKKKKRNNDLGILSEIVFYLALMNPPNETDSNSLIT